MESYSALGQEVKVKKRVNGFQNTPQVIHERSSLWTLLFILISRVIVGSPLKLINRSDKPDTVEAIYLEIDGTRYDAVEPTLALDYRGLPWLVAPVELKPWDSKIGAVCFQVSKIPRGLRFDDATIGQFIVQRVRAGKFPVEARLQHHRATSEEEE
jgi:hypothetical protein